MDKALEIMIAYKKALKLKVGKEAVLLKSEKISTLILNNLS